MSIVPRENPRPPPLNDSPALRTKCAAKKVHLLCILCLTVKLDDQYIHDLQEKIEKSYQKRITDCPTFR